MIENYEHFITRNIRAYYKRRLLAPICYLLLLVVLWFAFPLGALLEPQPFTGADTLESAYTDDKRYVTVTFGELTFTGYTSSRFGNTNGYWYYGVHNRQCYIVLLSPSTCEEGLPKIHNLHATCRIVKGAKMYEQLLENLASDLDWTAEGIVGQMPAYYFSEPDSNPLANGLLFFVYFGTGAYALFSIIRYLLFILFPVLSPACQNLIVYGNPFEQFAEAEEELATLPQLATEDMFITEHYFIMTSPYGNAIVPIQEILWIYKYSTLQKFLWYHFSITYTLHISANKHLFIQCPENIKSDIDGIIDYLSEANHNIMVGFNESNRLKAQANQGKPFHIEKLYAFLRRKV
ncbi:MAG: hypothetical protein E7283_07000 [Lachnospiraceae bacterium]|nr:hypothetical protein [Lachnospiraceae bacterium]